MTINPIDGPQVMESEFSEITKSQLELLQQAFKLRVGSKPARIDGDKLRVITQLSNSPEKYQFEGSEILGGNFKLTITNPTKRDKQSYTELFYVNGKVSLKNYVTKDSNGNILENTRVEVNYLPMADRIADIIITSKSNETCTLNRHLDLVKLPGGEEAIKFYDVSTELENQNILQGSELVLPFSELDKHPELIDAIHTLGSNALTQGLTDLGINLSIDPSNCKPIYEYVQA